MSYSLKFRFSWDSDTNPNDIAETVSLLVEALARHNQAWLRYNPGAPELYESGVVYRQEKPDREEFLDIGQVLNQGHADCEDLCAWRIAELRAKGVYAIPHVLVFHEPKERIPYSLHIQVARPDGIEDPSVVLGMK